MGAVERDAVITNADIKPGDVILGIASSGVHSNGFSLVRKAVERAEIGYHAKAPFSPHQTMMDALLTPTRIYIRSLLPAVRLGLVKGMAHITGGGLLENIPRVLPKGTGVQLDPTKWEFLPVFKWLKSTTGIDGHEMARTFNCGIGMVVICSTDKKTQLMDSIRAGGETVTEIGHVISGQGVDILNLESAWQS